MSPETSPVLSAQEEAIESGKKVIHGTVTDRILRLYEATGKLATTYRRMAAIRSCSFSANRSMNASFWVFGIMEHVFIRLNRWGLLTVTVVLPVLLLPMKFTPPDSSPSKLSKGDANPAETAVNNREFPTQSLDMLLRQSSTVPACLIWGGSPSVCSKTLAL